MSNCQCKAVAKKATTLIRRALNRSDWVISPSYGELRRSWSDESNSDSNFVEDAENLDGLTRGLQG